MKNQFKIQNAKCIIVLAMAISNFAIAQTPMSKTISDSVIVAATRTDGKQGVAYTQVSKEDLKKQNLGQDIPVLLNLTPSVVVSSDAGNGVGYTGIRIRGSDATRINVTVNGIPMNDAESHGLFWVNMPDLASSVNSIQIQRGAGTSTNGAGAFGASINIQSNVLNAEPYAEVNSSAGSFNTFKNTVMVGSGLVGGKFTFDARLSKITSDGFVDRAASDLKSFFVSGGYYGTKTIIRANVFSGKERTYQSWYGIPEAALDTNRTYNFYTYDNQTDNYQQDHYQLIGSHSINNNWNLNLALHYTRGKGYYEEFREQDDFANYGLPNFQLLQDTIPPITVSTTDLVRQRWLDNHFYGLTYSVNYKSYNRLSFILGGGANQYRGAHYGNIIWMQYAGSIPKDYRYYDNDAVKTDINVYGKANYDFGAGINAFVDLQYRHVGYSFLGFDNNLQNVQQDVSLNFFNPKAGINVELPSDQQLYLSVSVAHREPTRDDFTQSTPASRPKAERMIDTELGYKKHWKNAMVGANGYFMYYQNQLVLTGRINDVGAYIRSNIDQSYRAGIELEGAVNIGKKVKLAGNLTFSQNKVLDFAEYIDDYDNGGQVVNRYKSTDISFSPNMVGAATLSYEPVKKLVFSLINKYVSRQYLDNTSNKARSLNPYTTQDLRINYNFSVGAAKDISLILSVNNLLNAKYEPNGYTFSYLYGGQQTTENYYYPQAGINVMGGVGVRF
jgi:iron complex outermembrane recepter protein